MRKKTSTGLILGLLSTSLIITPCYAATTQSKISAEQGKQKENEKQLNDAQGRIKSLESKKNNLEEYLTELNNQLSELGENLQDIQSQSDARQEELAELETQLGEAQKKEEEQYSKMKLRIQYMYENGGSDAWVQILLESDSLASMLSKVENTEKMYAYDRAELKEMKEAVQEVKDLETKLENEKSELETAKEEQEGMKGSLQTKIDELKANASDYEAQIANVKAQAEQYKNLIAQQTAELEQIQAQEEAARKEQERQQQAQQNKNNSNNNKPANNNSGNTNNNKPSSNKPSSNKPSNSGGSSKPESQKPSSKPEAEKPSTPSYNSGTGASVVAYAKQFIGNPYVYGGNSLTNGIDCSGFTQQIYGHFGYSLPRTSGAQASSGVGINYSEHRAGDLIVYPGHVAILTGDGGIVHASNSAPYPKGGIKYTANALYRSPIAVRRIVQ